MATTKIGIASLLGGDVGSVELPVGTPPLTCPHCGEEAADSGQCIVSIRATHDPKSQNGPIAVLQYDCRMCGNSGDGPTVFMA